MANRSRRRSGAARRAKCAALKLIRAREDYIPMWTDGAQALPIESVTRSNFESDQNTQ
jgi:hypothetical protein